MHEETKDCTMFLELFFVWNKSGSFIPRGIEMLFLKIASKNHLLLGDLVVLLENIIQMFCAKQMKILLYL